MKSNFSKNSETDFDLDKLKKEYYNRTVETKKKQLKHLNIMLFLCTLAFGVLCLYIIITLNTYKNDLLANEEIKQISLSLIENRQPENILLEEEINENAELSEEKTINPEIQVLRDYFNNEDIVGYISIDGTNISYPVAQSSDNDFYLTNDLYKEKNSSGSIFLDYENETDFSDWNNVIYGHNMRDGSMFHNVRYYENYEYFEENPIIELITLEGTTKWEIYAFFAVDIEFNYIQVKFNSPEDAYSLISQMKELSQYDTGVEINPEDKVLTLSTCTNRSESTRYVISAKYISEINKESTEE